jgi:hypothetical protein
MSNVCFFDAKQAFLEKGKGRGKRQKEKGKNIHASALSL